MIEQEYFGSELGVQIWKNKYRNNNESFDDWLTRVSGGNAEVYSLIKSKKFMFGGRILANRGIEGKKLSLSNCYYIPIKDDSIKSIYKAACDQAVTYSYSGGCGTDLSVLAPRGAHVNNAAKTTSGAVSFMDLFSTTAGLIGMDGRRAALLLSLKSEHPDLREFITAKSDNESIKEANLSVRASNVFMNAVCQNLPHYMSFKRHTGEVIEKWDDANEIMDLLVKNNYDYAEPGILYDDRMCNYNMMQYIDEFEIAGVNPCGEACLPDYGACLLGSINLSEFVDDGEFDFDLFTHTVRIAINALNDVLDEGADKHPLKEQCDVAKKWRQIGLGVMGYADMLIKLGITYGSEECIEFTVELSRLMFNNAVWESSAAHSVDDNIFSPIQLYSINTSEIIQSNCNGMIINRIKNNGLRNATLLSIAPTGSISTMLGISGGIEPHYALSYTRRTESLHGEEKSYEVEIPILKEYRNNWIIGDTLPKYFVTAKDIHWKDRLRVQEAWQNSIDASISSTINLPEDTTEQTIKRIYIEAWKRNLKGITVYRDNCSRQGVLSEGKTTTGVLSETKESEGEQLNKLMKENMEYLDSIEEKITIQGRQYDLVEVIDGKRVVYIDDLQDATQETIDAAYESSDFKRGDWNKLSDDITYIKRKIYTGCGKLTLFIGYSIDKSRIEEIWIKRSGKGGCARSLDALAITMSSMLRLGGNIENIEKAFEGLEPCGSFTRERAKGKSLSPGSNCASAMLKELQQFMWEFDEMPGIVEDVDAELDGYDSLVKRVKDGWLVNSNSQTIRNGGLHEWSVNSNTASPAIQEGLARFAATADCTHMVTNSTNQCPECKSELMHSGGCVACNSCGYTRCD